MQLSNLKDRLNQQRKVVDAKVAEAKLISANGVRIKEEIESLQRTSADLEQVAVLLGSISEERQKETQAKVEKLVSQGLQKIFGPEWSFHVVSSVRGKTPIVEFKVRTMINGKVLETSVVDARGAGLASVVGFLLRLVIILLSKKASLLVLDETFANLSDSYIPLLIEFIREVVDKTELQIVMVTHEQRFIDVADRCYQFSLDSNGHTRVQSM